MLQKGSWPCNRSAVSAVVKPYATRYMFQFDFRFAPMDGYSAFSCIARPSRCERRSLPRPGVNELLQRSKRSLFQKNRAKSASTVSPPGTSGVCDLRAIELASLRDQDGNAKYL